MTINLNKKMFGIYSFLFIYTMINREFLLLGLDLRFVILVLGVLLIFFGKVEKTKDFSEENKRDKIFGCLFALFIWSLISNISWIWNDLDFFSNQILNQNILIFNNLVALIVYKKYRKYIEEEKIKKQIIFACLILVVSFIFTGMGYSLSQISGSNTRSMVQASEKAAEHKNIYGGNFRIAGYAEDPNYASLFLVLGIITSIQVKWRKFIKIFLTIIFSIAFGFSCSKTILLSFFIGLIYLFIINLIKNKDYSNVINYLFVIVVITAAIILPSSGLLTTHSTMTTRFKMWNMAKEMFFDSPIIGNGINSFKSYINNEYAGTWYVQPHSTYWQLLAETGIVGLMIFINTMLKCLNNENLSKYNRYFVCIFFIFIMNFETIQLQIIVYIIYILSLFDNNKNTEVKHE